MTEWGGADVSRETIERLKIYEALLRKWNPKINLVANSTMSQLWSRHFLDSIQLVDFAPNPVEHWVDLGSGGGFPGLVVAIMAIETACPIQVTLVESDTRKCAFLRSVVRETGAPVAVINKRIEAIEPLKADVLSARALADLSKLLSYADRHLAQNGVALFPKGETWKKELSIARSKWNFDYQTVKSKTEDGPVILKITGVSSV